MFKISEFSNVGCSQDIHILSQIPILNCIQLAVEKCNRESAFEFYSELSKPTANPMQISTLKEGYLGSHTLANSENLNIYLFSPPLLLYDNIKKF